MAAATSAVERATALVAQMGGLAILAATLAAVTALVYRWYVRELVPRGLPLLVGLSGVAIHLNTTAALGQVINETATPTEAEQALFNIAAFAIAAGGAAVGRRVGDQFGTDVLLGDGFTDVEGDVGRLVKSVGRVVTVELPEDIDDVTGYDPVPEETKAKLAGRSFLFPRRLTVGELRERLVHRLKTDYAVGHVDVELADDGTVEYLALGSRAAGIGPTLPPATNAVAIRADPAFAASAGDLVQVWETDPMRRVLTAELRGVADETVTIAIDAADTPKVDSSTEYRLVTLPVTDRPDREFASLLRAAEETFSSVAVEAGSPLHGLPVGALALAVVAVQPEDGEAVALPESSYVLAPGDIVSAIARPDALRRLETAGEALDPSVVRRPEASHSPGNRTGTDAPETATEDEDESVQAGTSEREAPEADAAESETGATDSDTETVAETGGPAPADDETGETATGTDEEPTGGQAGPASFDQLKDEFESGEADWDDEADETGIEESSTAEAAATDEDEPADDEDGDEREGETTSPQADASSFQQLKDEFESGDADWDDSDAAPNPDDSEEDTGFEDDPNDALAEAADDLDRLLDDDGGDGKPDADDESEAADDGLDDLAFDEEGDGTDEFALDGEDNEEDDLAALGGGEEEEESLDLDFDEDDEDDSENDEDEEDEEDENDDGGENDEDDDGGDDDSGGGGKSFQQLKEEFESGDADWEDDISDSPGGDMRLDE